MIYWIVILVLGAVGWNFYERHIQRPLLATFIGDILTAIFDYNVYQITYTNLTAYTTPDNLFEFTIGNKVFRLVPKNTTAITLGEVVIVSTKTCTSWCIDDVLQHEFVHVDQYRKLGSLHFFIIYLYYFGKNLVTELYSCKKSNKTLKKCWKQAVYNAYEAIPLEVEARRGYTA